MNTKKQESLAEREIVLTRVVDAPRSLVWKLWTDRAHVPHWWGPTGFTTVTEEMDVRPGGRWKFVMRGPDGRDYPNLITYLEVVEPERLVYKHGGEKGVEPVNFTSTVTLEALGPASTRVTMHSVFPSSAARDFVVREYNAIEGGKQHLARLAERAATFAKRTGSTPDFVFHRVVSAPRALVYEVWTQREHLARWFGPKGCTISSSKLDLRPDGVFLYCMSFPGGHEMWGKWVFREIVAGERLVFVVSFSNPAGETVHDAAHVGWPLRMLSTVTFEDHAGKGGGTVVTVRWNALDATPEEQRTFDEGHESMRGGWTGTFDQLAEYLGSLAGP